MANWAAFAVVSEDGGHDLYESRSGAVGIDLDLLAGPGAVLPFARSHPAAEHWRDDLHCEGGALIDPYREVLLFFAWEGPSVRMRHRAAFMELMRRAWPGWRLRWAYGGPAELRSHPGPAPAPEVPGGRNPDVYPGPAIGPDDEDLADDDPLVCAVTVGTGRCHAITDLGDHPVAEGPGLLGRLASAPRHRACRWAAESGIHIDPERRRVGWWLLDVQAGAYAMAERWPGWTVEFWEDRWEEHVRASGGLFAPPPADRGRALAEVREEALRRLPGRSGTAGTVL
ncbi:hypothetical protein GCM10010420_07210 [Streptomyces glaucosporus]|uniref:Uncharacterized protein n=1 Tax=Streptomyces glaucosporus TaxID=284044 RepID=A0ABP5UTB9_9ACTN